MYKPASEQEYKVLSDLLYLRENAPQYVDTYLNAFASAARAKGAKIRKVPNAQQLGGMFDFVEDAFDDVKDAVKDVASDAARKLLPDRLQSDMKNLDQSTRPLQKAGLVVGASVVGGPAVGAKFASLAGAIPGLGGAMSAASGAVQTLTASGADKIAGILSKIPMPDAARASMLKTLNAAKDGKFVESKLADAVTSATDKKLRDALTRDAVAVRKGERANNGRDAIISATGAAMLADALKGAGIKVSPERRELLARRLADEQEKATAKEKDLRGRSKMTKNKSRTGRYLVAGAAVAGLGALLIMARKRRNK